MSADLAFAVGSLILYGAAFTALLYIGKIRPAWRLELFGLLFVILSRVVLYMAAALVYSDVPFYPPPDFISWLSRFSSLMMGIIINIYMGIAIYRHRK